MATVVPSDLPPSPIGQLAVQLSESDLRLTAANRSATRKPLSSAVSSAAVANPDSPNGGSPASPAIQRSLTATAASKMKKALGMKSLSSLSPGSTKSPGSGSGSATGSGVRILMRVRRAFLRIAASQVKTPHLDPHITRDTWSELPADLLISVFERLSFANFQRARSICSSWHSASRQCAPKSQIHWLILYNKNSCMLFNPEEKDKLYQKQDLELSNGFCITACGSWLLMRDPLCANLYILNLFTRETINLPPVESQLGMQEIKRDQDYGFIKLSPVLWVDEKTKDYVVLWRLKDCCVVYSKKGDMFWNPIPRTSDCYYMVYKDHKLYLLSVYGEFRIFDFSGGTPRRTFACLVPPPNNRPFGEPIKIRHWRNPWSRYSTKLVVTVTGEVLKVDKLYKHLSRQRSRVVWSFRVYKVCSSGLLKKKEQIKSLGEEAMLFDQGITVLANGVEGFIRNAIYFSYGDRNTTGILVFNLNTRKVEPLQRYDWSSGQFHRGQWFLPSFTQS